MEEQTTVAVILITIGTILLVVLSILLTRKFCRERARMCCVKIINCDDLDLNRVKRRDTEEAGGEGIELNDFSGVESPVHVVDDNQKTDHYIGNSNGSRDTDKETDSDDKSDRKSCKDDHNDPGHDSRNNEGRGDENSTQMVKVTNI